MFSCVFCHYTLPYECYIFMRLLFHTTVMRLSYKVSIIFSFLFLSNKVISWFIGHVYLCFQWFTMSYFESYHVYVPSFLCVHCASSWGVCLQLYIVTRHEGFTLIYRLWLLMRGSWGFWRSLLSFIDCDSSWGGHEGSGGVYPRL
jgi:hypothetical protein